MAIVGVFADSDDWIAAYESRKEARENRSDGSTVLALSELIDEGVIEVEGDKVRLKDPDAKFNTATDEELAAELSHRSDDSSIRAWKKGLNDEERKIVLEANESEPFAKDPSKRLLNINRNQGLVEIIFLSDDNKKIVIKRSLDPDTLN